MPGSVAAAAVAAEGRCGPLERLQRRHAPEAGPVRCAEAGSLTAVVEKEAVAAAVAEANDPGESVDSSFSAGQRPGAAAEETDAVGESSSELLDPTI